MNSGMSLNEALISYLHVKIPRVSNEGTFCGMRYTYTYVGPLKQKVTYFTSRSSPELKRFLLEKYSNE